MKGPTDPTAGPYALFMLGLSAYVLAALAAQTFFSLRPETHRVLEIADFAICSVFLFDFLRSLKRANNRGRYFFTWSWYATGWRDKPPEYPGAGG